MRLFAGACALIGLLAGCPTRDQVRHRLDAGVDHHLDGAADSHDGGRDVAPDLPLEPNAVSIVSPLGTTYTNGTVNIVVATERPVSLPIAIYADSTEIGTIVPPSSTFAWNTKAVAEKTYSVTAQIDWNGQTLTSGAVMVTVDRTAPTITQMTPAAGATNVVLVAPIKIATSEPLLRSTVTPSAVAVSAAGVAVPTTVSLDSTGQLITVSITSDAGIALPQTFTATLSAAALTDLAGNSLAVSSSTWTWMVPDWIQLPPFPTYTAPALAVSPDFQAGIVYTQCPVAGQNGCTFALHVAENDGQGWDDLGQPGNAAGGGSLAFDSKSRAVVSWAGMGAAAPAAFVATWNGTSWDLSLPAFDVGGDDVSATVIRLDSTDHPVLAVRRDAGSNADIYVARWTGAAWDTSFGSLGVSSVQNFDLLLTPQGAPVIGLHGGAGFSGVFQWNGAAWDQSPDANASAASVALDANGNPSMIANWRIQHLTNGSWLPLTTALLPSSTAAAPHIANTPNRSFALAWWDNSPSPAGIGVARWTGTAWDTRPGVAHADNNSAAGVAPSLVVDARGSMWIGWFAGTNSYVWMSNY